MYDSSIEEKRSYFRIQLNCPVKLSSVDGSQRLGAKCVNMSIKGILLEMQDAANIGEQFHVLIEPGLDISPALAGLVEVLRVEYDNEKGCYRVAGTLETEIVI